MCQFVDDSQSAFPLSLVHPCMVDSWEVWNDYRPYAPRPVGDRGVWVGYDPTGTGEDGDGAGLVVVLPARSADERHRLLERQRLKGEDYEAQAAEIRKLTQRYRIEHIGIDVSGLGEAVAEHVEKWFPTLTRFRYDPAVKGRLVMQAQQIMRKNRLEFDAGWSDLAQSFMAIKRELTASGRQYTYTSGRSQATGHADLAWATMHASVTNRSTAQLRGPADPSWRSTNDRHCQQTPRPSAGGLLRHCDARAPRRGVQLR